MFINIVVGNSCNCNSKSCELLIKFENDNGSVWNTKCVASMLKLCGNDYVVGKFGRWFEMLVFIGDYSIGSVGAIVCHCFCLAIVEIDDSVGAISNIHAIVVGCCDYYLWILIQLWLLLWYNHDSCVFDGINNWILP